jgi:hypothetical protein
VRLEQWNATVQASGIAELIGFVDGLANDAEAVANGCTESWSNGMVEGFVNTREVDQTQNVRTGRISVAPTSCPAPSNFQRDTSPKENALCARSLVSTLTGSKDGGPSPMRDH